MADTHTSNTLSDFCPENVFANHPNNRLNEPEFNWFFRSRESSGFKLAFVRVNARKFVVHIPTFVDCLSDRRGS